MGKMKDPLEINFLLKWPGQNEPFLQTMKKSHVRWI
jgi:hypothetical protein